VRLALLLVAGEPAVIGSLKRIGSAVGSRAETLPKKLFSSAVASDVCESVAPIMPNLNGLAPSFAS